MDKLHPEKDCEKTFAELDATQVEQVGGGVMVPLPINPVINWVIRQLVY